MCETKMLETSRFSSIDWLIGAFSFKTSKNKSEKSSLVELQIFQTQ